MLKAYHDKPKPKFLILNNKLGLENPRLGNDQQTIKLQNSQILNNLGTKLSHLPLVQRKELAEVITQYREVFPDVPSKTNSIEHEIYRQ